MTVAIALLLGATIVAVAAPRGLRAMAEHAVDPVVVIVGWILVLTGVLGTACTGLVMVALPARFVDNGLAGLVSSPWWSAVRHAPEFVVYRLAGWAAAMLGCAALVRVLWVGLREALHRRSRVRGQLEVLGMVGDLVECPRRGPSILWLQSDRAAAFSLGGRPGTVVLTDGLRRRLSPLGLDAVLAHERAHLRGRHHLLVAAADVLARAFPFVRLFQSARRDLREQVELVADISAVRACGADAVRNALMTVTGACAPEHALAMARNAVDRRLRYLATAADPPSRWSRITGCGAFGGVVAVAPMFAASALLIAISLLATAATALG
ncbi:M56 family metallopeptidase [Pseudonocardia asaccharolytica]|uniref:Peptidase M48 n=1 Tax=Pseudonocardia asaccharolytica DSM 44247 = NBRC 16224 TaxID=1123024 RepID=A0A511D5C9_9PSEU|nr:M56 family metallopeptidase [Pseudonocardia asaccharolytica]GEL19663.1 peptidase M48 [Pseudonocardia asaccharolytica DSM 44247 = NBRC 16224]